MPDRPAQASIEADARIIKKIIGRHGDKLPEGKVVSDDDRGIAGPILAEFEIDPFDAPGQDQAAAVYDLNDALRSEIIAAGTDHWPYVRIRVEA